MSVCLFRKGVHVMGSFGWDKLATKPEKISFPKETKETVFFWKYLNSRNERIHISFVGTKESLCNNTEYKESECEAVEQPNTNAQKKKLCQNCARILSTLSPEELNNHNIREAKRTVSKSKSKKSKKYTKQNQRLQNYKQALNKTTDDFREAMEKKTATIIQQISEDSSLPEALNSVSQSLTILRKHANNELDQVVNDWKKIEPGNSKEFALIQKSQQLKHLVQAIDFIKSFPTK